MAKYHKIIKKYCYALCMTPLLIIPFIVSRPSSALSYQENNNITFTFTPTISINVSGDLYIDNLAPGSYSDSNVIAVDVNTNTLAGYTLTATVGSSSTTTSLVNNASSSNNNIFTSLSTADTISELSILNDDYWGYSYCISNDCSTNTNWISGNYGNTSTGYSGLPLDTNNTNTNEHGKGGTTLLDTTNPSDTNSIKFKIGAKASTNKASGAYTNTINFYAISKVPPLSISDAYAAAGKQRHHGYYTMQDMTSTICNAVELYDEASETQLIDTRDNKLYWVAKLKDQHCWMTQNLDIAGGTTLSVEDTDFASSYDLPTTNGWSVDDGELILPNSGGADTGISNYAYVSNSNGIICGEGDPCYSYYSWDAATLGSGRNLTTENTDAPYSICPKGWGASVI